MRMWAGRQAPLRIRTSREQRQRKVYSIEIAVWLAGDSATRVRPTSASSVSRRCDHGGEAAKERGVLRRVPLRARQELRRHRDEDERTLLHIAARVRVFPHGRVRRRVPDLRPGARRSPPPFALEPLARSRPTSSNSSSPPTPVARREQGRRGSSPPTAPSRSPTRRGCPPADPSRRSSPRRTGPRSTPPRAASRLDHLPPTRRRRKRRTQQRRSTRGALRREQGIEVLRRLASAGADVDVADKAGIHPSHRAASQGRAEMIRARGGSGPTGTARCDIEARNRVRQTPLVVACEAGQDEAAVA